MSGAEVTYDKELKYLHHLFKALPESIPVGDVHNFFAYLCADTGCVETVVNHWSDSVIVDSWGSRKAGKKKIWGWASQKNSYFGP
jgi:hypothetical protein